MSRPYLEMSIDDLETVVFLNKNNPAALQTVQAELALRRQTKRVREIHEVIEALLNKPASTARTASPSETKAPQPMRSPGVQPPKPIASIPAKHMAGPMQARPRVAQPFPTGALLLLAQKLSIGPVRMLDCTNPQTLTVSVLATGETYQYQSAQVEAALLPIIPGQQLIQTSDPTGRTVGEVVDVAGQTPEGLRRISVTVDGRLQTWLESDCEPAPAHHRDPWHQFLQLTWHRPSAFKARWGVEQSVSDWHVMSDGIPAVIGARVKPLGHQLYAARRILWDRQPRFVLADEVGLGKTIEAGLVLQSLAAAKPDLSILLLAPGAMTRQWFCEMYLRFGARVFHRLDASRLATMSSLQRARTLKEQRLAVSTTTLLDDHELAATLAARSWDLVILDEAHQFPVSHPLYPFLRKLSAQSQGFLALSATPSKRDVEGMLSLLALVAPETWSPQDKAKFQRHLEAKQEVWDKLSYTLQIQAAAQLDGEDVAPFMLEMLADEWEGLDLGDEAMVSFIERLREGNSTALDELVAHVQEYYRIDHRLIRTRRATLTSLGTDFCPRSAEVVAYDADSTEAILAAHLEELPSNDGLEPNQRALKGLYHRVFCTSPANFHDFVTQRLLHLNGHHGAPPDLEAALLAEPGPDEEAWIRDQLLSVTPSMPSEAHWLRSAINLAEKWKRSHPRGSRRFQAAADWIRAHLAADDSHKVLVFAQDAATVVAFGDFLERAHGPGVVERFHHRLDDDKLGKVAQAFQRRANCRILVSDELGGEGRNFQMASAVLHLDQPWSVARLEQRIGRLDRLGRDASLPVHSVLLCGPGAMEQALLEVHTRAMQVYSRSVGGMEFALPRLQAQISRAACSDSETLRDLVAPLAKEVDTVLRQGDQEFEQALDAVKPALEQATDVATSLGKADLAKAASYLLDWAKAIGVKNRHDHTSTATFDWMAEDVNPPLRGLEYKGDRRITFEVTTSRKRALADESLQFFAPGHKLADALIDALKTGPVGRVSAWMRDLGPENKSRLFLLVVGRCEMDLTGLPAGLAARAERRLHPQSLLSVVQLRLSADPATVLITDPTLLARLQPGASGSDGPFAPHQLLQAVPDVPHFIDCVKAGIDVGLDEIRTNRQSAVEHACQTLSDDLRYELAWFRSRLRLAQATTQKQDARTELDYRQFMLEAVKAESVQLEAIALIVGT